MTQQPNLKIVATGMPDSLRSYQLALDCAFAAGVAFGSAMATAEKTVNPTPENAATPRQPPPKFP